MEANDRTEGDHADRGPQGGDAVVWNRSAVWGVVLIIAGVIAVACSAVAAVQTSPICIVGALGGAVAFGAGWRRLRAVLHDR